MGYQNRAQCAELTVDSVNIFAPILFAQLLAVLSAAFFWNADYGFWMSLLAYSLTGAVTLVAFAAVMAEWSNISSSTLNWLDAKFSRSDTSELKKQTRF